MKLQGKVCTVLLVFIASSFGAHAAGLLEEVVVTAQKREQSIQDVGIAITAFTGEQVDSLGWHTAEDLGAQTPGLISTSFSGDSITSFYMVRGVGQADFSEWHEAPTAVYRDGAYIPNMTGQNIQMYDIDRVEVLKGPQGTLFGRNATGGLVHIVSRKPTEEFEFYGEAEFSEYDTTRFEGAASGPLADNIQGRISFVKNDSDGYVENNAGPDLHQRDDLALRTQLQAQVSDSLEGHLSFNYSNVDDLSGFGYKPVLLSGSTTDFSGFTPGPDPFRQSMASEPTFLEKEAYQLTGTITYDLTDNVTLTSVTDYQESKMDYKENTGGDLTQQFSYESSTDIHSIAQELRLNGSMDRVNWAAGVYYLYIDGDFEVGFDINDFDITPVDNVTVITRIGFPLETESWAVFGQMDYLLTDSLTVTAGLRYTEDRKDMLLNATCASGPNPHTGVAIPTAFGIPGCPFFGVTDPANVGPAGTPTIGTVGQTMLDRKDDDITAKIQLDWQVSDDTLVYAGFNRGMKAGGYSPSSSASTYVEDVEYSKEVLHAYEVGLKTDFFDGRARLNAAAFYYDYIDYQAFFLVVATNDVVNHDAEVYGGEVELFVTPAEGWNLGFGLSLLDATVKNVSGAGGANQEILLAPDLSANFLVRKEWQLTNGGSVSLQFDGFHVSDHTANSVNSLGAVIDDYTVVNTRLNYRHSKNWEASLFVKNLGDEEYYTYAFDVSGLVGPVETIRAYAPPRWVGGSIRYTWE